MQIKDQFKKILFNFINVVRINVFLATADGQSLFTPDLNPYGWDLLADAKKITPNLKQAEDWFEYVDAFGLHHFALKLNHANNVYLVLGPVFLNKKPTNEHTHKIAVGLDANPSKILESLQEVRVISQNQLKSILDLFLNLTQLLDDSNTTNEIFSRNETKISKFLRPILDLALQVSNSQSGSIMLLDDKERLSVHVAKGLAKEYIYGEPMKLNEGIAGTALLEGKTFFLSNKEEDSRISTFLKRKEIKQSVVMPFQNSIKSIRGVLNLNLYGDNLTMAGCDLTNVSALLTQVDFEGA